jgi:hypothetical protein
MPSGKYMKIETHIRRKDLIFLNTYYFPRAKWVWGYFFFMLILISCIITYRNNVNIFSVQMFYIIKSSFWGALVTTIIVYILCQILTLLSLGKKSGILGKHCYEVKKDGLLEITDVNESLHKWNGIKAVKKNNSYILVQINEYLFHLIPKRAFDDEQGYNEFYQTLINRIDEKAFDTERTI